MKKILLLISLLYSTVSYGQTSAPVKRVSAKDMIETDSFEQDLSVFDMKIFHDRKLMQAVVQGLYEYETDPQNVMGENSNFTQAIFSEHDSNVLEKIKEDKQVQFGLSDQNIDVLLQESYDYPFTTFKKLIINAQVPLPAYEEISEVSKVDKQAIPNFIQVSSEAGPAIGAKPVSVVYEYETQNPN